MRLLATLGFLLLLGSLLACARSSEQPHAEVGPPRLETLPGAPLLRITDGTKPPVLLDRAALAGGVPPELVTGYDPYYQREKRYWAVPLAPILRRGLPGVELETAELVLRASDGYAVPLEAARLLDGTAYLALADAERLAVGAGWEPIGPRRADPTPFYLVWKGADRVDLERYPRPWALERIEHARFEDVYPHTVPVGAAAGSAPVRGYAIFRRDCIRCHAVNREGGRVGPELNVPRGVLEYWPAAQVRAYIRDPLAFRYGAMPAHPQLTDEDLDGLVAYFGTMQQHKHDPERVR